MLGYVIIATFLFCLGFVTPNIPWRFFVPLAMLFFVLEPLLNATFLHNPRVPGTPLESLMVNGYEIGSFVLGHLARRYKILPTKQEATK